MSDMVFNQNKFRFSEKFNVQWRRIHERFTGDLNLR